MKPQLIRWLLLLGVCIALPALASNVDRAREEFFRGNEAYMAGDYRTALSHFEQAYLLAPNARLQEYIGRVNILMERYPEAMRAFEQALSDDPELEAELSVIMSDLWDEMRTMSFEGAQDAVARGISVAMGQTPRPEEQMRAGLGTRMNAVPVQVLSSPRGAEIYIDGIEFGAFGVTPMEIPLFTGPHLIEVRKANYESASRVVQVSIPRRGESIPTVSFTLERQQVPVEIEVTPRTARVVFIADGGERFTLGLGSYEGTLPAGSGTFLIQGAGRDRRVEYNVQAAEDGAARQIALALDENPAGTNRIQIVVGTLRVVTQLVDATVEVDGREIGRGPGTVEANLTPGLHVLRVTLDGHRPFEQEVQIDPNGTSTLYVNQLERTRRR